MMPKWVVQLQSFLKYFFLTYFTKNFIGSISFFSLPCPVLAWRKFIGRPLVIICLVKS